MDSIEAPKLGVQNLELGSLRRAPLPGVFGDADKVVGAIVGCCVDDNSAAQICRLAAVSMAVSADHDFDAIVFEDDLPERLGADAPDTVALR